MGTVYRAVDTTIDVRNGNQDLHDHLRTDEKPSTGSSMTPRRLAS